MASPFERSAIDAYPTKPAWDAVATEILGSMLDRWHLSEAHVFPATAAAVVAAVRRQDGSPAVLKIGFPHEEAIWEAVLLDGLPADLAPSVLDQDAWSWAMLLERLDPGTTLADAGIPDIEAVGIGAELHRRLLAAPPPSGVPALAEQYRPFVDRLAEDAAGALLRDAGVAEGAGNEAIDEFDRLCRTAPAQALLHGDLNPGNILRHGDGWRIIDPKPALGDPAFDTFSLVRDLMTDTGSPTKLAELTEAAVSAAGVDLERAIRWIRVRGILSAFWNLEDGLADDGRRDVELAWSAEDLLGLPSPR
ncbi:aminoglycoside phosphotransferase family protein [Lysobacter korlensis]|uniref:Aminoglycoside phosphotransferase family protein n=1 Tax=Lysobacter korlensis TaxID=553636 RepID=A0ABV6RWP5_9GAMM